MSPTEWGFKSHPVSKLKLASLPKKNCGFSSEKKKKVKAKPNKQHVWRVTEKYVNSN